MYYFNLFLCLAIVYVPVWLWGRLALLPKPSICDGGK